MDPFSGSLCLLDLAKYFRDTHLYSKHAEKFVQFQLLLRNTFSKVGSVKDVLCGLYYEDLYDDKRLPGG